MTRLKVLRAFMLGFSLIACTKQNSTELPTQKDDSATPKTIVTMKNMVSIVEIPTKDFSRAVVFYKTILAIDIDEMEMEGIKMGLFPSSDGSVAVQLINGSDYKPSGDGVVVYLNGGEDLQDVVKRIEASGGKIVVPKTEIGPEMGFYAMFIDTEGNKLGLHSYK